MGPSRALGLLLAAAAVGASSHSLHYLLTVVSEPSPGLPQYFSTGHFDDQLFVYYDSETRNVVPRVDWVEETVKVEPEYWDWMRRKSWMLEQIMNRRLATVMGHYNHSEGLHTLQRFFGCTLSQDGLKGGSIKFSYDGRESLSFDKETLTWTASDAVSEAYKRIWEAELDQTRTSKFYLEEPCISRLLKHLEVKKKAVEKRVAPALEVTPKAGTGGPEALICHVHGFYPKEIDATWRKEGKVMTHKTVWGSIAPNSDGTYYTWLSIETDAEERDEYQCHVECDGLSYWASEEPSSAVSPWIIVGSVLGSILTVALPILLLVVIKKRGSQTPPATKTEMQEMNPSGSVRIGRDHKGRRVQPPSAVQEYTITALPVTDGHPASV